MIVSGSCVFDSDSSPLIVKSKEDNEAQRSGASTWRVAWLSGCSHTYGNTEDGRLRCKLTTSVNYWQLICMTFGPKHQWPQSRSLNSGLDATHAAGVAWAECQHPNGQKATLRSRRDSVPGPWASWPHRTPPSNLSRPCKTT
jgi:hypothetical protein